MSLTGSSRFTTFVVLLVVGACVVTAGCASVQQSTMTGNDTADSAPRHWTVTITRIVDGDTVKFEYKNGTQDTGRLLGVDTPEVHIKNDPSEFEGVPNDSAGSSCLRDWGHKASEFANTELAEKTVTITLDKNEGARGYYGRLLIYIREGDGTLFNYQLVKQGYARVYDSQFTKRERFYAAESTAQKTGLGLWECANGGSGGGRTTTSSSGGSTNSGLAISRIHADAPGNDNENLNEEYLVLKNTGSGTLDISGWSVSDAAGHQYRVPAGTSLAAGATLTLHTGSGAIPGRTCTGMPGALSGTTAAIQSSSGIRVAAWFCERSIQPSNSAMSLLSWDSIALTSSATTFASVAHSPLRH